MKKVTLEDIKNHFNYCSDEGLTIGEYEEVLLERLYRSVEGMQRYIKNGIDFGYIDDREGDYKKFLDE